MSFLARLFAGCLVLGTLLVFLAGVAGFSLYRFSESGSVRDTWSLPLDGASALVASVDIDSGDVSIADSLPAAAPVGAETAVEAEYLTSEDAPTALAGYTTNGTGYATLGSAPAEPPIAVLRWLRSPVQATWDIGVNPSVPVELTVDVAIGDVRLDLTGLTASRFEVTIGAGEASVLLGTAGRPGGVSRIQVGVGDVELIAPADGPARIRVTAGLGNVFPDGFAFDGRQYTNAAFDALTPMEQARVPEIVVEAGTGDVILATLQPVVTTVEQAGPAG
ncbi:MAG: hypothetical protein AVDCRST_MAG33-582 [uncultured Thermomicrobiales bacterium]|uniref:DUF2154 domain-containing protein n=1 Tax=uncultured Thermomicrobiales bacterium TaxID=1645740 RepID=A0A6J4UD87_9BACT|nr:MAG: hypothetical protein AVDCRST_MAG33-582 [uncultured Thermomicrobiales bacterium]